MRNADTYRHLAKGCEKKAHEEQKPEYRSGWHSLAESCRSLADQAEHLERRTQEPPVDVSEE